MLLKSPRHYRAVKARAVQSGNRQAAAEAEIGLRAAKIAKAIDQATADEPLPPSVIAALRDKLQAGAA